MGRKLSLLSSSEPAWDFCQPGFDDIIWGLVSLQLLPSSHKIVLSNKKRVVEVTKTAFVPFPTVTISSLNRKPEHTVEHLCVQQHLLEAICRQNAVDKRWNFWVFKGFVFPLRRCSRVALECVSQHLNIEVALLLLSCCWFNYQD